MGLKLCEGFKVHGGSEVNDRLYGGVGGSIFFSSIILCSISVL